VNVGHVQQRDIADGIEPEQVGFGQSLLRDRAAAT